MGKIKQALYYVGLPFLMLMGVIAYLMNQLTTAKDQLQGKKRDEALGELANALKEANRESTDAESDYLAARAEYLRHNPDKS